MKTYSEWIRWFVNGETKVCHYTQVFVQRAPAQYITKTVKEANPWTVTSKHKQCCELANQSGLKPCECKSWLNYLKRELAKSVKNKP